MDLLSTCEKIGVTGFMHPAELEKLAELAVNKDVLEVGSFKGLSAFCMAIGAKNVYCVDTFKAATDGQRQTEELTTYHDFTAAIERFSNVQHCISSSEAAAKTLPADCSFDLIFLDAMHTYEDVQADICRWWRRLRPGGLMVFHDYTHPDFPGVQQAVDEIFGPQEDRIGTLMWIRKPWKAWRCE